VNDLFGRIKRENRQDALKSIGKILKTGVSGDR
jgi:hypothetical protein